MEYTNEEIEYINSLFNQTENIFQIPILNGIEKDEVLYYKEESIPSKTIINEYDFIFIKSREALILDNKKSS